MLNVIVIDDCKVDSELMRSILATSDGINVTVFTDSMEAMNAFVSSDDMHVDMVFCDYQMPNVSGLELLIAFRSRFSDVPFLFVSGHTNKTLVMRCKAHGANGFIAKPFRAATLLDKVTRRQHSTGIDLSL